MAKLPKEVLHKTFTLLEEDVKTLLQLQLTCKEWAQVAKEIFYKSINVSTNAQKASSLQRTLQLPDSSAALNIKHFEFSTTALSDHTNLSSILSHCPNLRSIKQFIAEGRYNYYPELLALRQQGHLQYLEQVDEPPLYPNAEGANADYIQLMLASRESVTKLYLCNYSSDQPSAFALTEHLSTFDKLKEVEIVSKTGITIYQVSTVLDSKHSYRKIVVKSLVFAEDPHLTKSDSSAGNHTLPNVKTADLHFRTFSVKSLRHIKRVLPRLNALYIHTPKQHPTRIERNHLERLEEFFEYLSHLDSFSIGDLGVSTDEMFALLSNATNHFNVDYTRVELDSEDKDHHSFHILTTGTTYTKSSKKGSKPNCGIVLRVNVKQVTKAFCQHLSKIISKKLQPLSVVLHGLCNQEDRKESIILGDSVDYILTHCKNLKNLELFFLSLSTSNNFQGHDLLFMDFLCLYECSMSWDFLTKISMAIAMVDKMFLFRGGIWGSEQGFDMPNTVIRTLHICDISDDCLFKVCTIIGDCRYYYNEEDDKYERLTRNAYKIKKLCDYELPIIEINALGVHKILCGPSSTYLEISYDDVDYVDDSDDDSDDDAQKNME
ncbi:unnamed protein product [Mucor fragilis]